MSLLTVLMPVYNGERFLREAIDSILQQTYGDFEFLIIDDNSRDASRDIISSYKDSRIKYIHNEKNKGQMQTLNAGFYFSQGRYIARTDQDDISLPQRLEKEMELLERDKTLGLVFSDSFIMDSSGKRSNKTFFDISKPSSSNAFEQLLKVNFIPVNTVVFRKSLLKKTGFLKEEYRIASEYDLFLRIACNHKILFIDESLAEYRIHSDNSSKNTEQAITEAISILKNVMTKGLTERQLKTTEKTIAAYEASLGMHYLFSHDRESGKKHLKEASRIDVCNFKAALGILMANLFPGYFINCINKLRRGRFK